MEYWNNRNEKCFFFAFSGTVPESYTNKFADHSPQIFAKSFSLEYLHSHQAKTLEKLSNKFADHTPQIFK